VCYQLSVLTDQNPQIKITQGQGASLGQMKCFNRNWLKSNSMKGITPNPRGRNVEVEGKKKIK